MEAIFLQRLETADFALYCSNESKAVKRARNLGFLTRTNFLEGLKDQAPRQLPRLAFPGVGFCLDDGSLPTMRSSARFEGTKDSTCLHGQHVTGRYGGGICGFFGQYSVFKACRCAQAGCAACTEDEFRKNTLHATYARNTNGNRASLSIAASEQGEEDIGGWRDRKSGLSRRRRGVVMRRLACIISPK
jgi:hypothetical protein